jgi:hypothetical protein
VLAVGLDGAGEAKGLVGAEAGGRGAATEYVSALGQRAGLVEQDVVDDAHPFERGAGLDAASASLRT